MSWLAASMLILALALAAGFAWYEREHPTARMLALVAALAALAALGRVAFAPLPNVKPTTDIVLIAGYALGGAPGFVVGAVSALASNVFFGQGPWTPWQMVAWGLIGLGGAGLAALTGRRLGRIALAAACGAAGLVYGLILNVSLWITYSGGHTLAELGAYSAAALPFDAAHMIGNVVFCLAFGPALVAALGRFRARFEVTWLPAPAAAAASLVLVGVLVLPAAAAASKASSTRYLLSAQSADGGFGGAPGQGSAPLHTGWAALGLAAAGRNPLDVRTGGKSIVAYLRSHSGEAGDLGSLARTALVVEAAGLPARDFAGRDLVAAMLSRRRRDGSFAGRVNTTAFVVLALRAAGRPAARGPVRAAARWIARQANDDGGFNFARRGGPSGIDDTSPAVQALVAAGRRGSPTVRRAVRFLVRRQSPDGGFPITPGGRSNAQSTAWAVQALVAAGRDPGRVRRGGRSPLAYLRSLTAADGSVRYSRTSTQTPVWVTAQALAALARAPFPLAAVPRRARRTARPAATVTATPAATATPAPAATPEPAPTRHSRRETAAASAAAAAAPLAVLAAHWAGVLAAIGFATLP